MIIMSKSGVFLHFYKFFESHFQKSKNNPVEILTGGCPLLKSVIAFEEDQSVILIEAFQDCYISSFNEDNLHSLLFVISAFGASFSCYCVDPLVFDGWGFKLLKLYLFEPQDRVFKFVVVGTEKSAFIFGKQIDYNQC